MSIEFIHAAIGLAYLGIWLLIGQTTVRRRDSSGAARMVHRTPIHSE